MLSSSHFFRLHVLGVAPEKILSHFVACPHYVYLKVWALQPDSLSASICHWLHLSSWQPGGEPSLGTHVSSSLLAVSWSWISLQAGGMCFESSDDIDFETSQLFRVTFGVRTKLQRVCWCCLLLDFSNLLVFFLFFAAGGELRLCFFLWECRGCSWDVWCK